MKLKLNIDMNIFNEAYIPYLHNTERITVFYGGGGSGKSYFAVQKMVLKYLQTPTPRTCLVCRNTLNSIKDSIFAEYISCLSRWGLIAYCKVNKSNYTIELPNGSVFLFKGLDDSEKIKSIANIDDIMIEEASEITLDDFTQLNLRLRSKAPNQQVILMFNPVSKANWVYKYFFREGTPPDCVIVHTTWKDNKFLPKSYIEFLESMKTKNPTYYKIYALGEFATLSKLVYDNWEVKDFNYIEVLREGNNRTAYFGLDFGYINDPTALWCGIVDEETKEIWVFDEHYQKGMLNNEIADMITRKGYSKETITGDSAEQKSIAEIRRLGVRRLKPSLKGKDSILTGIQFVNQFKIYVHPSCIHTIEELENYAYKKDRKTNEYINEPIDEFNHLMDAMRYALEELTRKGKISSFNINKLGF